MKPLRLKTNMFSIGPTYRAYKSPAFKPARDLHETLWEAVQQLKWIMQNALEQEIGRLK